MAEENGEKTIDPTPYRRQQARQRGQVARSSELASAGMLLGMLAVLIFCGGQLLTFLVRLLTSYLSGDAWTSLVATSGPSEQLVLTQWNTLLSELGHALLPVLVLAMLLGIGVNLVQTGWLFLPSKLAPDTSRIDPRAGLTRIFSLGSLARLSLAMVKFAVILGVAGASLYERRVELLSLANYELPQLAAFIWEICLWTCVKIAVALLVLASLDYLYQRWRFEQDLKMTPQEMREEMRNLQGDPQVAARRRNLQRQRPAARWVDVLSQADVMIASPGQLAVVLKYDRQASGPPRIVAKGNGLVAEEMQRMAAQRGVPVVNRPLLAHKLHGTVPLEGPVPADCFAEVAEILAVRDHQNAASRNA